MKEYVFKVSGMRCGMCEAHVNDVVRKAFKVKSVKSNKNKKETVVIADELDTKAVIDAIHGTGYDVSDEVEVSEVKKTFLGYKKI